jgi:hypothetical protein
VDLQPLNLAIGICDGQTLKFAGFLWGDSSIPNNLDAMDKFLKILFKYGHAELLHDIEFMIGFIAINKFLSSSFC